MRTIVALALLTLLAPSTDAVAGKTKKLKNSLLSVVEPHPGEPANAHPFVNVIVTFGRLADFTPADPATFKARMGRDDVTSWFTPTFGGNGAQTGVRGTIPAERVKLGRRKRNVIRLSIQAVRFEKGPRVRDVDRVRFGAIEGPNQRCTAEADVDTDIIVPGVEIGFTGSKASSDPDRDELTYQWTFGDGGTSTEADPTHVYDVQTGDVTATLTVSDGQDTCTSTVTLEAVPALDPGKTPGELFVESETALEVAAVDVGATGSKTFTLKNLDEADTSQVRIRVATTDPAFTMSETSITLGPGESHEVSVVFAPTGPGHRHARISLVANASNRQAVSLFTHGFGGASSGAGPTFAADTMFFTEPAPGLLGLGTYAYTPDGGRIFVDNGVHTCSVPGGGTGNGDFCVIDQDCAANNGTCSASSTCVSGDNSGQPCTVPNDCPNGFCPAYILFDPVDFCSDGSSLFLISDEGSFTDPNPAPETERAVTVMRMDYEPDGTVTKRDILARTTTETAHIACDDFQTNQGGGVYIPEYHEVPDQGTCFRSDREALLRLGKAAGAQQVITPRIDAYEGLGDCDDLDPVMQLETSPDASQMLAGFESGGLWQIRPTPIFFSADITEQFQIHPDGSVLFASTTDSGSTGFVNLYRITKDQVQSGPLPYSALVPCGSLPVPNNTLRDAIGRTVVFSLAATRNAPGSTDATALVSFVSSSGPSPTIPSLFKVVSQALTVRGTIAFSAPANTTTCSPLGVVMLDAQEFAF
jgi:PKD repeat protein